MSSTSDCCRSPSLSRRSLIAFASSALLMADASANDQQDIQVFSSGYAVLGARRYRCAIGRGGVKVDKHEGDGASPIGAWPLREVIYRADRLARPKSKFPTRQMKLNDGWCDAPTDPFYNKPVTHPFPSSAERLWRADNIYDLIVVVGYNDAPAVPGKGSAIFLHVARRDFAPTAGCIAFAKRDLLSILSRLKPNARVIVSA